MTAAQYHIDPDINYRPTSVACVVFGQLFPHGGYRFALCRQVWHKQSSSVDDRLIDRGRFDTHCSNNKNFPSILTAAHATDID